MQLVQIVWGFIDPKTFKSQTELLGHWNVATGSMVISNIKLQKKISIFS